MFKKNLSNGGIANPDFFKSNKPDSKTKKNEKVEKSPVAIRIGEPLVSYINETVKLFNEAGMKSYTKEIGILAGQLYRKRFTVAVVGEFSKGKSTFINRLFEKEILPVGNMPTTAMLTRIRYNEKEMISVLENGKDKKLLPLEEDSWDNYIAALDGNDPTGVAFVGLNSPWLKNGIEIIDTPGAGDLEEKRAMLIDDALRGSESAIVTVSAEQAMSMSEKLFMEERLIAKKTPYLMLIITKMDRIDVSQRPGIISYVKEKLNQWKIDIPVFVPQDVEMPDISFRNCVGMDKVKAQIDKWIKDPKRKKLTEEWMAMKMADLLETAIAALREQDILLKTESESKKQDMIAQKKEMLEKAKLAWEDIRMQMQGKSNECYNLLMDKSQDLKNMMVERLQYEAAHAGTPQKWWTEDYPYRLKLEMTNMSTNVENLISRKIAEDAKWLNAMLDKNFKSHVLIQQETVAEREIYTNLEVRTDLEISDLSKERNISRIGITALSIAAYFACASLGVMPMIGSMGVGTGGAVLSENIFKKKIDEQRTILKEEIARSVPIVVENAMRHSEGRVKSMYQDIIAEASKQETIWLDAQNDAVMAASNKADEEDSDLENLIAAFKSQQEKLLSVTEDR